MKQWFLFYTSEPEKLAQGVRELQIRDNQDDTKLYQAGKEFPLPFALVPWGQHIEIITKSKNIEEALFYIHQVIDKGLSRTALINCFKANLYEHQGKITNNFPDHLPDLQSKLVQLQRIVTPGTGTANTNDGGGLRADGRGKRKEGRN